NASSGREWFMVAAGDATTPTRPPTLGMPHWQRTAGSSILATPPRDPHVPARMAELIVETGPRPGTKIVLSRDTARPIGSGAGSTLRLESPGVEREHAVIKALKDEGFGIKALAGDTRVDGEQITATRLPASAKIELAGIRLRYSSLAQKSEGLRAALPAQKTD